MTHSPSIRPNFTVQSARPHMKVEGIHYDLQPAQAIIIAKLLYAYPKGVLMKSLARDPDTCKAQVWKLNYMLRQQGWEIVADTINKTYSLTRRA